VIDRIALQVTSFTETSDSLTATLVPGLHSDRQVHYCAAFVLAPDRNTLEAVTHAGA